MKALFQTLPLPCLVSIMRAFLLVLSFVAMTFLCWGMYGPVLHEGQYAMGDGTAPSSLRPFICVGISYFLIAVVVPLAVLFTKGERGSWTFTGTIWSFAAGMAGAVGALGIILAFKFRGSPVYVMPLVFGLAPVVNTFVTMWMTKTFKQANVVFFAGVIVVAIGAAGVLFFKPTAKNVEVENRPDGSILVSSTVLEDGAEKTTKWVAASEEELASKPELAKAHKLYLKQKPLTARQFFMIPLSIALTALCWGSYGPTLHKGQMKMSGSRLRPFLCVGFAYFLVAVLAPLPLLGIFNEPGGWDVVGSVWSLAAGAAGACGALGIVLAFNFGGKPIFVMPLVFGGAPVVNTFITIWHEGTASAITAPFYSALLLVIGGAVTVLIFSPKPGKKPAGKDASNKAHESDGKSKDKKASTDKSKAEKDSTRSDANEKTKPLVTGEGAAAEVHEETIEQDETVG